jgi:energy-coupling factor transporter ATP-binding protein EcfA2
MNEFTHQLTANCVPDFSQKQSKRFPVNLNPDRNHNLNLPKNVVKDYQKESKCWICDNAVLRVSPIEARMFESIEFKNFKALRDTTLPLSRFTLIVGPNGSGKTTALKAISFLHQPSITHQTRSVGAPKSAPITVTAKWIDNGSTYAVTVEWADSWSRSIAPDDHQSRNRTESRLEEELGRSLFFSFDAIAIAAPVTLLPHIKLLQNGANLAGVLDRMRDESPERFEQLNEQLSHWIPEFNRILFETPDQGRRTIALRTRLGDHIIPARELSQGTLIALALLTLAFLPQPPSIVCLEEPDRGLHPRLLRDVRDALYRLAHPESFQENRPPVQVIATTHNPYFLDLFREHPEEIVIAEKVGLDAKFSRLSDRKDLEEILGDAPLSEVWYSGVLGGVPAGT